MGDGIAAAAAVPAPAPAPGDGYRGRFAPSPTGPLHAGSLVAALASWLDARAHGGHWLVRIEDVDTPRCRPGTAEQILAQLACCGLVPDEPPWWQHARGPAYADALARLTATGLAYRCRCTRAEIAAAWAARGVVRERFGQTVYPGTCRSGERGGAPAPAWRLRVPADGSTVVAWWDARHGAQRQDVAAAVGDFVLQRADGCWTYQLAVVVDDAAQRITHVVRGDDLLDNTPRQIVLQRALGLPTPHYRHTPLVRAADGHKLSKQNGAAPLDLRDPLAALRGAARGLALPAADAWTGVPSVAAWLERAAADWAGIIAAEPAAAAAADEPAHVPTPPETDRP